VDTLRPASESGEAARLRSLGNPDFLKRSKLAIFCSTRCPGSVILLAFDLAQALRESGLAIIGGFHTPMKRECLNLLLRGPSPLVVCPARDRTFPAAGDLAASVNGWAIVGDLFFDPKERRATADLADRRNAFVSELADEVLMAYAAPGSRTEAFAREPPGVASRS
jgi:hypothetical protein